MGKVSENPGRGRVPRKAARADGAALSRQRIVDAALEIVAADGLAGLSTRKLGARLGCEAMSIYHHFAGKHGLLDALVDHVLDAFEWPASGTPLQRLRAVLYAYRAMAHRFPAMYPLLAVHRLNTPTGVRFIERLLAHVQAVIADTELAARHFRTLGYFVTGAALDETAGYAMGPSAAEPVDDAFITRECPRLAASARWFRRAEWDRTFELGVDAMLAAVLRDAAA